MIIQRYVDENWDEVFDVVLKMTNNELKENVFGLLFSYFLNKTENKDIPTRYYPCTL